MLLVCPECELACPVEEDSANTATCPSCGGQLISGTKPPKSVETRVVAGGAVAEESSQTSDYLVVATASLPAAEDLPYEVGRYKLTHLVGHGGFAQVYQAFDSELVRQVAIKLPRRDRFVTKEQLNQFLREARVCAKLEHPGIVRIYDVGWLDEDTSYISMELCSGGSLSASVERGEKVPPLRAAELVAALADAIHFAHINGLVHRDLKPSNILFGSDRRPRIADFGLAMPEEWLLDQSGEVAGTLPYMSPEQVRGESHLLDGRSDIWSLGAILYELVSGRRPFLGESRQLSEQILKREPKPLRQIVTDLPVEIEQICLKCLRKSVSDRYATAEDLARELRSWLESVRTRDSAIALSSQSTTTPQTLTHRSAVLPAAVTMGVISFVALLAVVLPNVRRPTATRANTGVASVPSSPASWMDQVVELRKYPLLLQPPRKLAWPIPGESATADHSEKEARVNVTSKQMTLLELGDTRGADFEVGVDLFRNARTGLSGLFWGYQKDPQSPTRSECYAVVSRSNRHRLGDEIDHLIVVSRLTFHELDNGEVTLVELEDLAAEPVDPLLEDGGHLNIRISAAGLVAAKWNGQVLSDIRKQLAAANSFSQPGIAPYHPSGPFGLLNQDGNTLYRNATFTLLNGNSR